MVSLDQVLILRAICIVSLLWNQKSGDEVVQFLPWNIMTHNFSNLSKGDQIYPSD